MKFCKCPLGCTCQTYETYAFWQVVALSSGASKAYSFAFISSKGSAINEVADGTVDLHDVIIGIQYQFTYGIGLSVSIRAESLDFGAMTFELVNDP